MIDKIKTETAVMKRVLSTVESYVNIMVKHVMSYTFSSVIFRSLRENAVKRV